MLCASLTSKGKGEGVCEQLSLGRDSVCDEERLGGMSQKGVVELKNHSVVRMKNSIGRNKCGI